jgi:hypothetical protein
MNHGAAFLLRLISVACRERFCHWSQENDFNEPCLFKLAADEYDGEP